MRTSLIVVAALLLLPVAAVVAALGFGGPAAPPPLANANEPYHALDRSDLPALLQVPARNGAPLAYRRYAAATAADRHERVVLVHGSAARGESMHAMARRLAEAGYEVYVPDVRGHGITGRKGTVDYIGQIEDDLEDLVRGAGIAAPRALVGFSAGGGFALRFAADARSSLFAHYVLLAPFLGPDATTYRTASGGWSSFGLPRMLGLVALNRVGVTALNDLPVNRFALSREAGEVLTPQYSFALWSNFRPHREYRAEIGRAARAMAVVVGANDEQFVPTRFAPEFAAAGRADVPVTIVPGVGHVGLTLSAEGARATVDALSALSARKRGRVPAEEAR